FHVHLQAPLGSHQFSQINREAIGSLKVKGGIPREHAALRLGQLPLKKLKAPVEGLAKKGLLAIKGLNNDRKI
ncbi:MAG: hypothetical protein P8L44_01820, partial [Opitutales bacterium]|nr:hypothetical protein [Opitutales bacterium]